MREVEDMASRAEPDPVPYVEPIPVGEEFASGAAFVEVIGSTTYIVFYVDQIQPPELDARRERRISRRIIIPNDQTERLARMLVSALGGRGEMLDVSTLPANKLAA